MSPQARHEVNATAPTARRGTALLSARLPHPAKNDHPNQKPDCKKLSSREDLALGNELVTRDGDPDDYGLQRALELVVLLAPDAWELLPALESRGID